MDREQTGIQGITLVSWMGPNLFYISSHLGIRAELVALRLEPVRGRTIYGGIATSWGKNGKWDTNGYLF